MKIIRASNNTRFNLLETEIVERSNWKPYFLKRSELRDALKFGDLKVRYYLKDSIFCKDGFDGYIEHGKSQRKKKFISIGCMRFVGVNRLALIRWAKGAK